jgi:MFS-type transporter involved in bile tolerance (Atg22 family)
MSMSLGSMTLDPKSLAFSSAVVAWSTGAAAQSPALVALAQEKAPKGREATALALPKAFGDGTYIVVPFLLGLVTDTFTDRPGIECAVAGAATLLGVVALGFLGTDTSSDKDMEGV